MPDDWHDRDDPNDWRALRNDSYGREEAVGDEDEERQPTWVGPSTDLAVVPRPERRQRRLGKLQRGPRHRVSVKRGVNIGRLLLPVAAVMALILGGVATWYFANREPKSVAVQANSPTPSASPSRGPLPGEPFLTATASTLCREGASWAIKIEVQVHQATGPATVDMLHVASSGRNSYRYIVDGDGKTYAAEIPAVWARAKGPEYVLDSPDTRWRVNAVLDGRTVTYEGGLLTSPC